MNLLILHLSDIHIKDESDAILKRGNAIGRTAFKDIPLVDAVAIALTGDIAFSGNATEYNLARTFVSDIVKSIKTQSDIPIHVLMSPGNHDCDFGSRNADVREIVIEKIRATDPDNIKESIIEECTKIQESFFKFRDDLTVSPPLHSDKLWQSYIIEVGGKTVIFHCLNVAWMSQLHEQQGQIVFPTTRYETISTIKADASIVCMHHPINWFSQASYRPFRQFVRKCGHLILTGHEHEQAVAFVDETDSGESVSIDGGVLQADNEEQSRFNLIFLAIEKQEYSVSFHDWDGTRYVPIEIDSSWSSFRRLPEKRKNEFEISADFSRQLDDAGARFTHHGKSRDLALDDVFVYPEMRLLGEDEKRRKFVDSANLRRPENLERGALIRGREQYGKTSLLRQLFRSYHSRGFVPIFVPGKSIINSSPREMQKIIEAAVIKCYGKSTITSFWQVGLKKRVLLLDDIDESKLSGKFFSNAIEYLSKTFAVLIVTCSEMFEFRALFAPESSNFLKSINQYELLEFGNKRRHDLIKRWVSLGDGAVSVEKLIALIDQGEGLVMAVLGEGVVPSTPFFVLTLLQSVESGSIANLQYSALGEYYRYLIIHSLELQSVSREEHNEILNYCAHLAWFIYRSSNECGRIDKNAFEKYHHTFADLHGLSLPFFDRRELLLAAKLLDSLDGGYGFRYPYLYYFFLGMYLAEHLDEDEVQGIIRECCKNLHRQENGNIILFLAHHSRDKRVYESILTVMQTHYSKHRPITFDDDVGVVNRLVESAPQRIYEDTDILKNRAELCELRDEHNNANRVMLENPDTLPSELIAIMSLMRTIDILGQFLKNHYGQLPATIKITLIKELFDGGLRGLRDLFELLFANSDGLVRSIEGVLEKRGIENNPIRRNARAKREMFEFLGILAFAFIRRCGVSVASPHLRKVIEKVIENSPTTANRLILSAIELEKCGGLENFEALRSFNKEITSNSFAQSILQQLVVTHMHLYPTSAAQKQRACAELKIEIRAQGALDLVNKGNKRMYR
ncbi:STAND family AAA ATPase [Azospira inquinata]|uniref:Metallophosphoesterase n=1 Tax=Azospira inquinata TaxID=2785627 RepID=A0A975XVB4_9RHOO|nr:metallophosphoesterase [Azospira inquinata]QWT45001.1 metallophosphoesterase [Azospira inquinata]QWT49666.1 metallophosphoesterase [Azospira inquinata]